MFNPGQDCCTLPTPHCYNSLFAVLDENYNRIPYISGQLQNDQKPIGRYAPCALTVTIAGIGDQPGYNGFCFGGSCANLNATYTLYQTQEGGLNYRGMINHPEGGNTYMNVTFATQGNKVICIGTLGGSTPTVSGYPGDYYSYGSNYDSNVNGATLDVYLTTSAVPACPVNQLCDYTGYTFRIQGGTGEVTSFPTYFNNPEAQSPYRCGTLTLSLSGITSKDSSVLDNDLTISGCKECENLNGTTLTLREFSFGNKVFSKQLRKYSNTSLLQHPAKVCDNYGIYGGECTNLGMDLDYITLTITLSGNLAITPATSNADLYLKFYGNGDTTTPLATFKETLPQYNYYYSGAYSDPSIYTLCCNSSGQSLVLDVPCSDLNGPRTFTMIQESENNRCNFAGMTATISSPDIGRNQTYCDGTPTYPTSWNNIYNPFTGLHLSPTYTVTIGSPGLQYCFLLNIIPGDYHCMTASGTYNFTYDNNYQMVATYSSGTYKRCLFLGVSPLGEETGPYVYTNVAICNPDGYTPAFIYGPSGTSSAFVEVPGKYNFSWSEDACRVVSSISYSGFTSGYAYLNGTL